MTKILLMDAGETPNQSQDAFEQGTKPPTDVRHHLAQSLAPWSCSSLTEKWLVVIWRRARNKFPFYPWWCARGRWLAPSRCPHGVPLTGCSLRPGAAGTTPPEHPARPPAPLVGAPAAPAWSSDLPAPANDIQYPYVWLQLWDLKVWQANQHQVGHIWQINRSQVQIVVIKEHLLKVQIWI